MSRRLLLTAGTQRLAQLFQVLMTRVDLCMNRDQAQTGRVDPSLVPAQSGVRSNVHILGHPIHPLLIPFPIAFLVGAAVTDLAWLGTGDVFWARASFWLIAVGVISGAVAAITGLIDFVTIDRSRRHLAGWVHLVGNVAVLGLGLANWLLRIDRISDFIDPWGLALSLITTGLLTVTGWTGGELAYRHQIGVTGPRR